MPTIGGMDKGYLVTVLDKYKTGLRASTIIGRIILETAVDRFEEHAND